MCVAASTRPLEIDAVWKIQRAGQLGRNRDEDPDPDRESCAERERQCECRERRRRSADGPKRMMSGSTNVIIIASEAPT